MQWWEKKEAANCFCLQLWGPLPLFCAFATNMIAPGAYVVLIHAMVYHQGMSEWFSNPHSSFLVAKCQDYLDFRAGSMCVSCPIWSNISCLNMFLIILPQIIQDVGTVMWKKHHWPELSPYSVRFVFIIMWFDVLFSWKKPNCNFFWNAFPLENNWDKHKSNYK